MAASKLRSLHDQHHQFQNILRILLFTNKLINSSLSSLAWHETWNTGGGLQVHFKSDFFLEKYDILNEKFSCNVLLNSV